jgi:ankyrin repeat protein
MNHRAIPFLARIAQGQTDDVVPILRNEYGQNPTAIAELCADRVALMEFWMTAEGVRINDQDSLGETVLQHAVHQGYAEAIPVLIQQGARADQALIKQAAAQGQTASLGALLDAGIPIQTIGRSSALGVAAIYGHTDTVRDLLARGADLEARNGSWQTPLYMAASRGHTDTMQVLLDAGAWVNPPKIGRTPSPTPLQGASEFGVQSEAAQLLLDRGAKIDAQNESGHTALMLAARSGNLEVVGLLNRLKRWLGPKQNPSSPPTASDKCFVRSLEWTKTSRTNSPPVPAGCDPLLNFPIQRLPSSKTGEALHMDWWRREHGVRIDSKNIRRTIP